ncbi:MAG: hypothetical protein P4M05_23645 [Bradyrhizobium sp.]|nr:hypothetical protein [Bradyrhizobium sp.]
MTNLAPWIMDRFIGAILPQGNWENLRGGEAASVGGPVHFRFNPAWMSPVGISRHFAVLRNSVAIGSTQMFGSPRHRVRRLDCRQSGGPDDAAWIKQTVGRLPGGQINGSPVESSSQKYSGSLLTQITSISFAIPARTEGRFAIVTNVGQGCDGRGWRC